jgi:hypothetical protein
MSTKKNALSLMIVAVAASAMATSFSRTLPFLGAARGRNTSTVTTTNSLSDLGISGLLAEFIADPQYMTFLGTNINTWTDAAGLETNLTEFPFLAGPSLTTNAFGAGKDAAYFVGNHLKATVAWTPSNMTAVIVFRVQTCGSPFMRLLAFENWTLGLGDSGSTNTWGIYVNCTGDPALSVAHGLGSDTIMLSLQVATNYVALFRKEGPTITGWLRPLGGTTSSNAVDMSPSGFNLDTFSIGGDLGEQNLQNGWIRHTGVWNRGLTDAEVITVLDFLSNNP